MLFKNNIIVMKVKVYGDQSENWAPCLLPLIKQGFRENNCELVENPAQADFLYCNDPNGYNSIYDDSKILDKPSIVNILDLPTFSPNFDDILRRYEKVCRRATAVTSISNFVAGQVKDFFDINSSVIYQPSKPVFQIDENIEFNEPRRFIFIGRANSLNKRFYLIKELMEKFYNEKQLLVVGSEDPGYGKFAPLITDEWLNIFYSMSDYVLVPSSFGGIELPIIEAILAGKFPIACNDCKCSMEFASEFSAEPHVESIYSKIQDIENNRSKYIKIVKNYQNKYKIQFSPHEVARKILEVYKNIS